MNHLYAGQDPPGVEEALESEHRAHAAFYPPVILFDNVVQVGTVSNLDGIVPTIIEFVIHPHAPQSDDSWLAVTLESFTEEGLGGSDVTRSTEIGFDSVPLFINSTIEVLYIHRPPTLR